MSLNCPICLQSLVGQKLLYACTRDEPGCREQGIKSVDIRAGETPRINCKSCRSGLDTRPTPLRSGVYAVHESCPYPNPFWDESRSVNQTIDEALGRVHAQVGDLRAIHALDGGRRKEMWFPIALLRASETDVAEKHGVLVALVGVIGGGKSSFATMAMSARGWRREEKCEFRANGLLEFIYEPPVKVENNSQKDFMDWIHLAARLEEGVDSWPKPTDPSRAPLIRATYVEAQTDKEPTSESPGFSLRGLWTQVVGIFGRQKVGRRLYPVIFYDSGGELIASLGSQYIRTIATMADVVMVVIDPKITDFPQVGAARGEGEPAVLTAGEAAVQSDGPLRTNALIHTRNFLMALSEYIQDAGLGVRTPTVHIVVSKADLYFNGDQEVLNQLKSETSEVSRARLAGILRNHPDSLINDDLVQMINNRGLVSGVRFVWIGDIPRENGRTTKPQSFNICKAVSDCLGRVVHAE